MLQTQCEFILPLLSSRGKTRSLMGYNIKRVNSFPVLTTFTARTINDTIHRQKHY